MLFSVITPSFGQLDWLRLCVSSVADQGSAGVRLEHIIQDGGSPGIGDFRASLAASDDPNYQLRIYSEKDRGMYDALNRGLAKAQGDVLSWLNSDEQYLPDTLTKVAKYFADDPSLDVLFGDAILLNSRSEPVCYRRIMTPRRWHTRLDHLHSLSCAMFFRRRALPAREAFDPKWKVIGDAVLIDHFLSSKRRTLACQVPLSTYSFTGVNLSAAQAQKTEHTAWQPKNTPRLRALHRLALLEHRIRRLFHGAYQKFPVHTEIYTPSSPHHRQPISGTVSGLWPKNIS